MESVISASMIVLVIRTRQSIFHSKPSPYLFSATIAIALITLIIPYTPLASVLGFQALPFSFVLILMAIIALYVTSAEIMKSIFYGWVKFLTSRGSPYSQCTSTPRSVLLRRNPLIYSSRYSRSLSKQVMVRH